MSNINEIRKTNLAAIIGREKIASFARSNGLTDQQAEYMRQIMRQKGARPLGGGFARTLEAALNLTPGSLDQPNPGDDAEMLRSSFARKIAKEAASRDVPVAMQQAVLYMLRTAPEKAAENDKT